MLLNIWTILKICGIAFLAASVIFYIRLFQLKLKFKGVYMPFHLPLIGILYKFLVPLHYLNMFKIFEKSPAVVKIMNMNFYLTIDLDEIKMMLNHPHCLNKNDVYFIEGAIENSIVLLPAEKWRPRRKLITKCFNPKFLDSCLPIFQEKASVLVEIIKTQRGMNIFKMFENFTYDSFCATTIGTTRHLQIEDDCQIIHILTRGQKLVILKNTNPFYTIDFIFWLFGGGREAKSLLEQLRQITKDIVNIRREQRIKKLGKVKYFTILDVLLELEEEGQIDEKALIDEMIIIIQAATDTSASTLAFACGLLGMHQDIQEKLYQEVIEVVGPEGEVHADQIPLLQYTEMVLNETMRLFPAAAVIGRKTDAPVDIGNRILPEGMNLFIPIFLIHRSKEYYKDPLKFDPQRFSPEEISKRPSYSFLPFSLGPRNCIGIRHALLIMKIAIVEIIRNYKIETKQKSIEEITLTSALITRSDNLECSFIPRQK